MSSAELQVELLDDFAGLRRQFRVDVLQEQNEAKVYLHLHPCFSELGRQESIRNHQVPTTMNCQLWS